MSIHFKAPVLLPTVDLGSLPYVSGPASPDITANKHAFRRIRPLWKPLRFSAACTIGRLLRFAVFCIQGCLRTSSAVSRRLGSESRSLFMRSCSAREK